MQLLISEKDKCIQGRRWRGGQGGRSPPHYFSYRSEALTIIKVARPPSLTDFFFAIFHIFDFAAWTPYYFIEFYVYYMRPPTLTSFYYTGPYILHLAIKGPTVQTQRLILRKQPPSYEKGPSSYKLGALPYKHWPLSYKLGASSYKYCMTRPTGHHLTNSGPHLTNTGPHLANLGPHHTNLYDEAHWPPSYKLGASHLFIFLLFSLDY